MKILDLVCSFVLAVLAAMNSFRFLYILIGLFFPAKKYPAAARFHRYAFVIPARNEERVVGRLIESIHAQNYPPELLRVYVVADNCTDGTAELCRRLGATVFERNEPEKVRKGYALAHAFARIGEECGADAHEGYFIFDADNLLDPDFTARMNEAFDAGARAVTSYRNTKNFDTGFISAAYGIHFYGNSLEKHRPRSLLGLGTHLTGTGYLLDSSLLEDGWNYFNLTEDDELTLALTEKGVKVHYCEAAEFYDEQPVDFATAFRQRVRWAKGRLRAFFRYGSKALRAVFKCRSFTAYDMFTHYFPYGLFTFFIGLIYPVASLIYGLFSGGEHMYALMLANLGASFGSKYLHALASGVYIILREKRHIRCPFYKAAVYVFLSPWFSLISVFVYIVAIFKDVQWTPIIHSDDRPIGALTGQKGRAALKQKRPAV